jgi:hypothetical protein
MFHNLINLSLADSTRKCDGTRSARCFILVGKLSEKEHKKNKRICFSLENGRDHIVQANRSMFI